MKRVDALFVLVMAVLTLAAGTMVLRVVNTAFDAVNSALQSVN